VIKIGLVAPFEGRYRYVGYDAIYAARLAVREINAAGRLAGWSLELVAYDDRADPELARATARNLIIDPDVVAVIGHYRQANTDAACSAYAEAGMPLLVVGAWVTQTARDASCATVWHMLPAPEQVAAAMVEVAWPETGNGSVASLPVVDIWGGGPLAVALGAVLRSRGYRQEAPPLAEAPSAEAPSDVVFSTLPPLETATQLTGARAAGWNGRLIGGFDIAAQDFATVAGAVSEGALFFTPYPSPRDLPGLEAWSVAYRAVGPHVPDPGIYALPTYEAIYTLAEAIAAMVEAGRQPSRAGVATALPEMRREGALGTLTWDAAGYWRAMPLYVYVWEQAHPRLVGSLDGQQ